MLHIQKEISWLCYRKDQVKLKRVNHSPTWKGTRNLSLASSGELYEHASQSCLELLKVCCIVKVMYDSNRCYEEASERWEWEMRHKLSPVPIAVCVFYTEVITVLSLCVIVDKRDKLADRKQLWNPPDVTLKVRKSRHHRGIETEESLCTAGNYCLKAQRILGHTEFW